MLDLFAAPGHETALAPVLEALLVRADVLPGVRRLNSVVDAANAAVRATLEEAGFETAGTVHEFVALGDHRADGVFYELAREEAPSPAEHVVGGPA
jgi:RimJ/RimL family protein N-acetyltransferase